MLPYASMAEAEAALGRSLTTSEAVWFHYSARMPDYILFFHNLFCLLIAYTLAPLPLTFLELFHPSSIASYKIQPKARHPPASIFQCYKRVVTTFVLALSPLLLVSYPIVKLTGIRTGLPLPSTGEMVAQLVVYVLAEDYVSYWLHRFMHGKWAYENVHHVHHELTAPFGFAVAHAHWLEILLHGIPTIVGPVLAPGHIITFLIWTIIRQVEAIDNHCGYDFPLNPLKYIPFYGGPQYHDYHHYIGGLTHSNFATIFTYCDYIYGTNKGYRFHKARQEKLEQWRRTGQHGVFNAADFDDEKSE
ncbi:very-long-chain aldehyde decarbonylase GL1-10-like [Typha angustifolia]|uniref:very-long-chain aldehyde decarbonylase GL1-10-like n=1 Tax=Typha angustifolia TaxID=59011 RepID=UPI003C2D27B6